MDDDNEAELLPADDGRHLGLIRLRRELENIGSHIFMKLCILYLMLATAKKLLKRLQEKGREKRIVMMSRKSTIKRRHI